MTEDLWSRKFEGWTDMLMILSSAIMQQILSITTIGEVDVIWFPSVATDGYRANTQCGLMRQHARCVIAD